MYMSLLILLFISSTIFFYIKSIKLKKLLKNEQDNLVRITDKLEQSKSDKLLAITKINSLMDRIMKNLSNNDWTLKMDLKHFKNYLVGELRNDKNPEPSKSKVVKEDL